ncbi:hypothetical protein OHB33_39415 (plasmid) [Streptomyces sp. NBC_01558]|uniref:hypothetical protein n=1 Tax=Streptomyces sp. NBC_01558 TaxID=2975878 RepID=UPI002DD8EA58|nr:hypothetical protein [Streptomyces sp. NBC_01558]WSD82447.1 hypothetical protein OHB33_39415 [Streptomyces sp. NBC_01558]
MNTTPATAPPGTTAKPAAAGSGGAPAPVTPPHWTEQLTSALREGLATDEVLVPTADALRLGGLRALHHWHARTTLPLLAATDPTGRDETTRARTPVGPLIDLHRRAAEGTLAPAAVWAAGLHPVLLATYRRAYPHAAAYAEAHANARDYALANGRTGTEADEYGHTYARLSTTANAEAFATAHADALTPALSQAYATADPAAYTATFPSSQTRATVRAASTAADTPVPSVLHHLATGLATALRERRH